MHPWAMTEKERVQRKMSNFNTLHQPSSSPFDLYGFSTTIIMVWHRPFCCTSGYAVGMSGGRPQDTTVAAECSIGISGGHPEGTTLAAGYSVGMLGGHLEGTTLERGYSVGTYGNPDIDVDVTFLQTGIHHPACWIVMFYALNSNSKLIHNEHLTNSCLHGKYVGNVTVFCGKKVHVKLLIYNWPTKGNAGNRWNCKCIFGRCR